MDASVAVKCLVAEDDSDAALAVSLSGAIIVAPELIYVELASVLAKKTWRGEITAGDGATLMSRAAHLFDETVDDRALAARAFDLAAEHRMSAYDSLYLALAERRRARVITADRKLVERARAAGLGKMVSLLSD
ncbi:MAG: type II toxin-antitoxin system VapC family toxin [Caulobacteraceae bacterium]